jgi:pyridoxine 4-dehydrogenase
MTGAGTTTIGSDLVVDRMGFGAMRLCGPGIWSEPDDPANARAVLERAVELGVQLIDTADVYGPDSLAVALSD